MQKNLGYVIPSLVIPDATTGIGYWYLGNVPLGVRATGTMWTIGADHYWYVDNTKTNYLAEIPVEEYNQQFAELLSGYDDTWDTWLAGVQEDWTTFFNTEGAAFTLWFNRMKNQLSTDAAGNLQAQIDAFCYNFSEDVEIYTISSQAYSVGQHIIWQNRYCLVIKNIAQGESFIIDSSNPNQNIEYTELEEWFDDITHLATGTLTVGSTTITIQDTRIRSNSYLDFYTSIYGVAPTEVTVTEGAVQLTFDAQETNMTVGVKVGGI